ncbi:MAG: T9SS type A sorting domain-containing protein [Bacteroidetes bacterium]|nr:T9SS type A sorting domain-containing protein [Bacteroidota bacterium]
MKNKLTVFLLSLVTAGFVFLPGSAYPGPAGKHHPVQLAKSAKLNKTKSPAIQTANDRQQPVYRQPLVSKRLKTSLSDINYRLAKAISLRGKDRHLTLQEKELVKKFRKEENQARSGKPHLKTAGSAYSESFESYVNGSVPSGWTVENLGDPASGFVVSTASYFAGSENETQYLAADDDLAGDGVTTHTVATSPVIDVSGATTSVHLSFYHDFEQYSTVPSYGKVFIVAGETATEVASFTEDTGWESVLIDITELALPADTIRLKFEYSDGEDWVWGWAVDDIQVHLDASDLVAPTVTFEPFDFVTVDPSAKTLTASITDESEIASASIFWSTDYYDAEVPTWTESEMTAVTAGVYTGSVGPEMLETDGVVVYYVEATDTYDNTTETDAYQYFLVPVNEIPYTDNFNDEDLISFFNYNGFYLTDTEGVDGTPALQTNHYASISGAYADSSLLSSGFFSGLTPETEAVVDISVTDYETGEAHTLAVGDSIHVWGELADGYKTKLASLTEADFEGQDGFVHFNFELNDLMPAKGTGSSVYRLYFETIADRTALDEGADFLITFDNFAVAEAGSDITAPEVELGDFSYTTAKTTPVQVTAMVTDDLSGVDSVIVYWGTAEEGPFEKIEMTAGEGSVYTAEIPGQTGGTDVYFYIHASDVTGNITETDLAGYTVESLFETPYLETFDGEDFAAPLWIYTGDHYLGPVGTGDSYGVGSDLYEESTEFQLVTTHFAPAESLSFSFQYRILEWADDGVQIIPGPAYTLQPGDSIAFWALVNDEEWVHLGAVTDQNHTPGEAFSRFTADLSAYSDDTLQFHLFGYYGGSGDFLFITDNYSLGKASDLAVPSISVDQEFLATMVAEGHEASEYLEISNTGLAPLEYSISVVPAEKATAQKNGKKKAISHPRNKKAAGEDWVTVYPAEGTVEAGGSETTEVTFAGGEPGLYTALLAINSNDEENSPLYIPVGAFVHKSNEIFGFNYFDGAFAYTTTEGGYVWGTNGYGDVGKYIKLDAGEGKFPITEVSIGFGPVNGTYNYSVVIRDVDEATGGPGSVLYSQEFSLANAIPAAGEPDAETGEYDPDDISPTVHTLTSPVEVSGEFFVGIEFPEAANDAEAFSIVHNYETAPMGLAWEQWSDGSFYAFSDPDSWETEWLPWIAVKSEGGVISDGLVVRFNSTDTVAVNSIIQVPVYTSKLGDHEVLSADFTVTYDPNVLQYVKMVQAGTMSDGMLTAINQSVPGTLTVAAAHSQVLSGTDSLLILIEFKGKAVGTSPMGFTKFVYNDGDPKVTTKGGNVTVKLPTDVAETAPAEYKLFGNYPNPFNPATTIRFSLDRRSPVTLTVYNALGQEVAVLLKGKQLDSGLQTAEFSGAGLGSGVYFYQLSDGHRTLTGKMLLMK